MKRMMILAMLGLMFSTGCQSTNFLGKLPWSKEEAVEEETTEVTSRTGTPRSMVGVWKDGTLNTNGKPIRGLAGRVYFNDENKDPVKVEGTLAVYAYQSNGVLGPAKVQPDRKFVFDAQQLQEHHSLSDIGDSYSFWLPWDAVGNEETTVTLLPVLRTNDGRIIRGEEVVALLPGPKHNQIESSIQELRAEVGKTMNKQVLYESNGFDDHQNRQKMMRTTTIGVPQDAVAVRQAMQEAQSPKRETGRIESSVDVGAGQVRPAAAVEESAEQAMESGKLPGSSDEAWQQALNSFRSRGAAMNQRLAPQNIQRY